MFDSKSRYSKSDPYPVTDHRGRTVLVVPVPEKPLEKPIGTHLRSQGERLDHLAGRYLDDPSSYWRICEMHDVIFPDALSETDEIEIPRKVK